jgi:hypothetical protein
MFLEFTFSKTASDTPVHQLLFDTKHSRSLRFTVADANQVADDIIQFSDHNSDDNDSEPAFLVMCTSHISP